jgi:ubiquinol-cytochrome c reductase cytochrome b/c1 subunit
MKMKINKKKNRIVSNKVVALGKNHVITYPTPKNLSYAWSFGVLAGLLLITQIVTGLFLAMHYVPHIDLAFASVEHICRDVQGGSLIRYLHANGASMFFFVVYVHIFRGLYYGSYMDIKAGLWISGIILFVLMMATAFIGYVLPWGQMSFWGATVITNLFSAVPIYGPMIVEWLWGGFSVDGPTLNRFYAFHFLFPFILAGAACGHIAILHSVGSSDPLGLGNIAPLPFHIYFTSKDVYSFLFFMFFFSGITYFSPNDLGHPDNYINANSLVTPAHIVPEWYFLPFYAILRSIPDKLGGVLAMFGAIVCFALLPFLNTSKVTSTPLRPYFGFVYWPFVANFLLLGWLGQQPVETPYIEVGMASTFFYFLFFLVLIPVIGIIENSKK